MRARQKQSGFTLIELMIAVVVMIIGLSAILLLFTTAINSNSRSKLDTQATLVAQMTLERLASQSATVSNTLTFRDCAGNDMTLATAEGGAQLDTTTGTINWGAETYAGLAASRYAMRYMSCGANNQRTTFEVRWNVQNGGTVGTTAYTKLITVSARQLGASNNQARFMTPVTLRTLAGM